MFIRYESGKSIVSIATEIRFSPCSLARALIKHRHPWLRKTVGKFFIEVFLYFFTSLVSEWLKDPSRIRAEFDVDYIATSPARAVPDVPLTAQISDKFPRKIFTSSNKSNSAYAPKTVDYTDEYYQRLSAEVQQCVLEDSVNSPFVDRLKLYVQSKLISVVHF